MKNVVGMLCVLAVVVSAGDASAQRLYGTGGLDFGPSLVPSTGPSGESGRDVFLVGTITGLNFEPGLCVPDPSFFGKCVNFTKSNTLQPGDFKRAHPGQTAFTLCSPCTIDGRTGSFVLKISYPNPKDLTFTKFTIQQASGGLAGLQGQGTLDFTTATYELNYHFTR